MNEIYIIIAIILVVIFILIFLSLFRKKNRGNGGGGGSDSWDSRVHDNAPRHGGNEHFGESLYQVMTGRSKTEKLAAEEQQRHQVEAQRIQSEQMQQQTQAQQTQLQNQQEQFQQQQQGHVQQQSGQEEWPRTMAQAGRPIPANHQRAPYQAIVTEPQMNSFQVDMANVNFVEASHQDESQRSNQQQYQEYPEAQEQVQVQATNVNSSNNVNNSNNSNIETIQVRFLAELFSPKEDTFAELGVTEEQLQEMVANNKQRRVHQERKLPINRHFNMDNYKASKETIRQSALPQKGMGSRKGKITQEIYKQYGKNFTSMSADGRRSANNGRANVMAKNTDSQQHREAMENSAAKANTAILVNRT